MTSRSKTILLVLIPIVFAGYYYSTHRKSKRITSKPGWNLLVISIDTVRTNDLGVYNTGGVATPALSLLASKGTTFTHAIAQAPYTLPSHATMLTGTYPMFHRVQENTQSRLAESATTLAEVMRTNGYTTAGFVGSVVLSGNTGLNQGFDIYDDAFHLAESRGPGMSDIQRGADRVYDAFHHWHSGVHDKYFAFLHFYDAHAPYEPPPQFRSSESDPHLLYRGELQYVDSIIQRVLQDVTLSNTIVAITGDHGEMFGEHGERGHGYFVYQDAVNVPLIVAVPGRTPGSRNSAVVSLVDLMPTLLELLELSIPKEVQGKSFANALGGDTPANRTAYSESLTPAQIFGAMPIHSLQTREFKYIGGPQPELYDLNKDPGERTNQVGANTKVAAQMKQELDEYLHRYSSAAAAPGRPLTPEQREQLAALGYISPSQTPAGDSSRDAKQYIEAWNDLNRLSSRTHDKPAEALRLVNKLREQDVDSSQIRVFEARALIELGRAMEAIQALQPALVADPQDPAPVSALCEAQEATHDFEEAGRCYEKVAGMQSSPSGLQNFARHMLRMKKEQQLMDYMKRKESQGALTEPFDEAAGEIFVRLGQTETAEHHLKRALKRDASAQTYILLSTIFEGRGDVRGALSVLESGQSNFEDAEFLLRLSILCNKAGKLDQERAILQRVMASDPQDPRSYFYMAKNFIDAGADPRQVVDLAQKGLSLHPDAEFEAFGNYLMADAYTALGNQELARTYQQRAEKPKKQEAN